ncbi:MAG TPA: ADP-ribosylglycohydrolase family protein [Anaerovoracaceae bacterium]|nr:ADP-ribosylglycohydrolase family protein [Anaerovoracaceae bacterium]
MIDRAYGALVGGAIGDAMGMPASFFTRDKIKQVYGYITDFLEPESKSQVYHGNLKAGEITDDTMESVIISDILIKTGGFDRDAFIEAMRFWAVKNKMLESTVIGPSTRKFLEAVIENRDTTEAAKQSSTNGSAMRVAPVGVKYYYDLKKCAEAAAESSFPSHSSKPCVAAACAVATAVAAGVKGGYTAEQVMEIAWEGARFGESVGSDVTAPSVAKRILLAKEIVEKNRRKGMSEILDELTGIIGAGMLAHESVPFSLGVFYAANGDAKEGIIAAVNGGDDADTNGAICGNISGAYSGAKAIPEEWKRRVEKESGIDFMRIAGELVK